MFTLFVLYKSEEILAIKKYILIGVRPLTLGVCYAQVAYDMESLKPDLFVNSFFYNFSIKPYCSDKDTKKNNKPNTYFIFNIVF